MSRSMAVITISCSCSASRTRRMPPWSSVRTLIPRRALQPRSREGREPPRELCRQDCERVCPGPWEPLDERLHDLEGAPRPFAHPSAIEHRTERIPLLGPLLDEIFEPVDHALHQVFFGFVRRQGEARLDVHVMAPAVRVLAGWEKSGSGFDGQCGRTAGDYGTPPEEPHADPRPLFEVAQQGHDSVRPERLGDGPDRRATYWNDVQSEAMSRCDDRIVEGSGKSIGDGPDPVTHSGGIGAGHVP